MKNLQLNVQELSIEEQKNIDGGFIPLVIWGITFTAGQVAAGAGLMFGAGAAVGLELAKD